MEESEYKDIKIGDYITATALSCTNDANGKPIWLGKSEQIDSKWKLELYIDKKLGTVGYTDKCRIVKIDKENSVITAINYKHYGAEQLGEWRATLTMRHIFIFERLLMLGIGECCQNYEIKNEINNSRCKDAILSVPIKFSNKEIHPKLVSYVLRKIKSFYKFILDPSSRYGCKFEIYNGMGCPDFDDCNLILNILNKITQCKNNNEYSNIKLLQEALTQTNVKEHLSSLCKYLYDSYFKPSNTDSLNTPIYGKNDKKTLSNDTPQRKLTEQEKEKFVWANNEHEKTLNKLKEKLIQRKYTPEENEFIDCYANINSGPAIFEVKSLTEDNELHQIRAAISQLYEYRFRHNVPNASLWIMLSKKPEIPWIIDYLIKDRNINVLWIENGILVGPSISYL